MAIGLLPTTRSAPPGAGIKGRVLENAKPTMPAAANWRAQKEAVPKWKAWRTLTTLTPCSRARAAASSTAAAADTWPSAFCADITTRPPWSSTTRGSA
ncbi:hypothetical protein D3C86_1754300 [compost metagenome]